jgi:hypothetical protein
MVWEEARNMTVLPHTQHYCREDTAMCIQLAHIGSTRFITRISRDA